MQTTRTRRQTEAERILEELRSGPGWLEKQPRPPGGSVVVRTALAAVAWLWGVFALCYVLVPALLWIVRGDFGGLSTAPGFAPAFVAGSVLTAFYVLIERPTVRRGGEPVVAATLGGLVAWAVAMQALRHVFVPLTALGPVDAGILLAQNVLEMGLLGAMWASFARRPGLAFALGAAFQFLIIGIAGIILG